MKHKTLDNLGRALSDLQEFLQTKNPKKIEIAGVIQAFEFSYELTWKAMKEFLEDQGFDPKSPKQVFKDAFQLKLIQDENLWLDLLKDRNLTVHTYSQELAKSIYSHIRDRYAKAMIEVYQKLKQGPAT